MMWLLVYPLLVAGVAGIEKRLDDVSLDSLATVVQRQATDLQQLQAKMDDLIRSNTQLTHVVTRLNVRIGFNSYTSQTVINVGTSNSPIVFDAVLYNEGSGYNGHTGTFTAPISGTYVLYGQLLNHVQHGWMMWGIVKGSATLCAGHLENSVTYDETSCLATVHLQQGDAVVVRRLTGDASDQVLYGGSYCSFSGFLLSADTA